MECRRDHRLKVENVEAIRAVVAAAGRGHARPVDDVLEPRLGRLDLQPGRAQDVVLPLAELDDLAACLNEFGRDLLYRLLDGSRHRKSV